MTMKVQGLIIGKNEWDEIKREAIAENYQEPEPNFKLKQQLIEAKKSLAQDLAGENTAGPTIRQKYLDNLEAENQKLDRIRLQEVQDNRDKVIENMRLNIWKNKDSTKLIRTEQIKLRVFKERDIQIEETNAKNMQVQEAECLSKIERLANAEKYKNELLEEKKRQGEIKKANSIIFLNELKFREDLKREEALKLKNEGLASIQRLQQEIENDKKEQQARAETKKKMMLDNLADNRKIVAKKKEMDQIKEEIQNKSMAITTESKKIMNRLLKQKEIKLREEKSSLFDKLSGEASKGVTEMREQLKMAAMADKEEVERKYQEKIRKEEELAKDKRRSLVDSKKMFEEEKQKETERLKRSRQWELERWQRENEILCELKQLHKQAKINQMNNYRRTLDSQCAAKRADVLANQQAERKDLEASQKLWHRDETEFLTFANDLVDKYAKDGVSVTPLLKAIQAYKVNSRL